MTCEETEELLPEYVLGALSADEAAGVARHLAGCPAHQVSLDSYQAVCDSLGASVPLVDPPAHLKSRLMARIAPQPARLPDQIVRRLRWSWAVAAAVTVLALAFGLWGLWLRGELQGLQAESKSFQAFVAEPDTRMIPLATTREGEPAKGILFLSNSQAIIWAIGLPGLSGDQVYECWWIDSAGRRVSGGTFKARGDRVAWMMSMPENGKDFHAFGVTLEPDTSDPDPQGPRVLAGEF